MYAMENKNESNRIRITRINVIVFADSMNPKTKLVKEMVWNIEWGLTSAT